MGIVQRFINGNAHVLDYLQERHYHATKHVLQAFFHRKPFLYGDVNFKTTVGPPLRVDLWKTLNDVIDLVSNTKGVNFWNQNRHESRNCCVRG